jgi:micrococcal nuclease
MKTKKHYLVIAIVLWILCGSALCEVEYHPKENKPLLIGQPEPALKGIRQLYIIVRSTTNAESRSIVFEKIENSVKEKIEEAGITIAESDVNKLEPNSPGARAAKILKRRNENVEDFKFIDPRTPELRINIDSLEIKDSNEVVFYVKTSLARLVYLGRDNRPGFKTDVWQSEPMMRTASTEDIPAAVTSIVLGQAEAFIHAYLAANPMHKRPSDVNEVNEATKEQTEPAAESKPAENKYVASKNSKVFHKPDCVWAKKIKPENLICYSSRDEAIKDGKKPCSQCKP